MLLSKYSAPMRDWCINFLYSQSKLLLNIKVNVSKEKLFKLVFGLEPANMLQVMVQNYNLNWIINSNCTDKYKRAVQLDLFSSSSSDNQDQLGNLLEEM